MKLFKFFSVAVVLLLTSVNLFAQETANTELRIKEEGRVEFKRHWWMQVQAGASHTVGETSYFDLVSPAAALNVGYQFSPALGVRVGASGWEGRGSWVSPRIDYKFSFVQANADFVVNLSNLICGWKHNRFFNGYGFIGVGLNHGFDNDEAVAIAAKGHNLEYLWRDSKNLVVGRAGLGADMRINDYVAVNVEVNANMLSDHFNSKKAGNPDWHYNALIGLKINLGRNHKVIPPVYYEPEPAPAPVKQEPAPAPVKEEPKKEVVKVEPMIRNIFFNINSAQIKGTEQEKVEQLIAYMKQNPNAQVKITGYADKGTGNANINKRISQKRADSVAKALKEAGIPADNIITDAKGDTEQPFSVNDQNRVSICVVNVEN